MLLLALCSYAASGKAEATSPDGTLSIIVENGKLRVEKNSVRVVDDTKIGLTTDSGEYALSSAFLKVKSKTVNQTLSPVLYHSSSISDHYNETTVTFKDFLLVLRAYDDAVAYRFVSRSRNPFKVISEQADFVFPEGTGAFVPYVRTEGDFHEQLFNSFENQYVHISLSDWNREKMAFLPITFESSGYNVCLTESDLLNFPGLMYRNTDGDFTLETVHAPVPAEETQGGYHNIQGLVTKDEPYIAECNAGEAFPWRVFAVAKKPCELIGSDVVYKLATPSAADADWSWVKPGKVAWDWWNDWNLKGVDFVSGLNTATYKYYIDFAASKGIEYVILDEGWSTVGTANLYDVIPEIDLKQLISYADAKNVGLILWGGYWAFKNDMEGLMKHYADMGIKGFKIDFMDRDDQQMVNFYRDAAQIAAKYHLVLDMHGAFKPCGLQRMYPNVLNFEGVYGEEMQKFVDIDHDQMENDCTIPFARMLAGSLDYTPGSMRNSTRESFRPIPSNPMSQGTRCHQLALYPIFEAPLLMCCDSPTNYLEEKDCIDFIAGIPTTWDETIGVDGVISDYAVVARRKGSEWYIGAISDWNERELEIKLDFLPEGSYEMISFADGPNAHHNAEDYVKSSSTVNAGQTLKIHLAPGGGWAALIKSKP